MKIPKVFSLNITQDHISIREKIESTLFDNGCIFPGIVKQALEEKYPTATIGWVAYHLQGSIRTSIQFAQIPGKIYEYHASVKEDIDFYQPTKILFRR